MKKTERMGVERLPLETQLMAKRWERIQLLLSTIKWISNERIACLTHVNTDLMRSPSLKSEHDQREGGETLKTYPMSHCSAPISRRATAGKAEPMMRVSPMNSLQCAALRKLLLRIPDDREIAAANAVRRELLCERMMCALRPRDHEEP